jgi:hypothetical protein
MHSTRGVGSRRAIVPDRAVVVTIDRMKNGTGGPGQFDIHGGLEEWRMSGTDKTRHLCEKCYEIVFT